MTTPWFIVCFIAVNVAFTGFIDNQRREIRSEKVTVDSIDGSKWLRYHEAQPPAPHHQHGQAPKLLRTCA
jgi:hypothetical protein